MLNVIKNNSVKIFLIWVILLITNSYIFKQEIFHYYNNDDITSNKVHTESKKLLNEYGDLKNRLYINEKNVWKYYFIDNNDLTSDIQAVTISPLKQENYWSTFFMKRLNMTSNIILLLNMLTNSYKVSTIILKIILLLVVAIMIYLLLHWLLLEGYNRKLIIFFMLILMLNNVFINFAISLYWHGWIILTIFILSLYYYQNFDFSILKNKKRFLWIIFSLLLIKFSQSFEQLSSFYFFLVLPLIYYYFIGDITWERFKKYVNECIILGFIFLSSFSMGLLLLFIQTTIINYYTDVSSFHLLDLTRFITEDVLNRNVTTLKIPLWRTFKIFLTSNTIPAWNMSWGYYRNFMFLWFTIPIRYILVATIISIFSYQKYKRLVILLLISWIPVISWGIILNEHLLTEPYLSTYLLFFIVPLSLTLSAVTIKNTFKKGINKWKH